MLVPSSMVSTVTFAGMPRLASDVVVVKGTVPVPVAGVMTELLEVLEVLAEDEDDPVELLDDVEPPDGFKIFWIAAVSCVLTRFKAVPLAMLANPFARLVSASPITEINELSADDAALCACACAQ